MKTSPSESPVPAKWLPVLAFALAAVLAGAMHYHGRFVNDDALITIRYAENLAAGEGLVYNAGERALGTTTPLWALLLGALGAVGLPVPLTASVLGVLAFGWTGAATVLLLRSRGAAWTEQALAALLVATSPVVVFWTGSGMETAFFVALLATFLWFFETDRLRALGFVGGALLLVRPDAGLVLAAAAVLRTWHSRSAKPVLTVLPGFLLMVAPWLVAATWYYGSPLPNSGFSKRLQVEDWGAYLPYVVDQLAAVGPLVPFAIIGLFLDFRDPKRSLPGWVFLAVVAGMSLGGMPGCPWYMPPVLYLFTLLAAVGAHRVATALAGSGASRALATAVVLGALVAHTGLPEAARQAKRDKATLERFHGTLGDWLRENAEPTHTVAADNLGYVGYRSGMRIIEMRGLIQSDVREAIAADPVNGRDYAVRHYEPEYVVMWKGRSSSHRYSPPPDWYDSHGYREVFSIPYREGVPNPPTYVILSRVPQGGGE